MRSAMHLDFTVAHDVEQRHVPKTHSGEGSDSGFDFQIHLVTGIEEAEIDLWTLEHEPERAIVVSAKSEEQDNALVGEGIRTQDPPQRPHEEVGIEILVREILARPAITPGTERVDHHTELATRGGQTVFV